MVVFIRLLPAIVLVLLGGVGIYYVGRRYGWWGKPRPRHAAPRTAAAAPKPKQGAHDELDPTSSLVTDVWLEARLQPCNKWLYTRDERMLRLNIVSADGKQTLYVEVVTSAEYSRRITDGKSTVILYAFTHGKDATAWMRSVLLKAEGAPGYELKGFAYEVAEGTPNKRPDDDTLRRLKTDMQLASNIDD